MSIVSFHATKIFHTIEGAAIVIKDDAIYEKAKIVRNYGIDAPDSVAMLGINAKMNDIQAAMGLCMLDEVDTISKERKKSHQFYTRLLNKYVQLQKRNSYSTQSHSYFPLVFKSEEEMKKVQVALHEENIAARQYFKPSLDTLPYIETNEIMHNSRELSNRILVIPMHSNIESKVSEIIIKTLEKELECKKEYSF